MPKPPTERLFRQVIPTFAAESVGDRAVHGIVAAPDNRNIRFSQGPEVDTKSNGQPSAGTIFRGTSTRHMQVCACTSVRLIRHLVWVIGVACIPCLQSELPLSEPGEGLRLATIANQADIERRLQVGEVRSIRRYILRNPRWQRDAVMNAVMISTPGREKRFEIISMEHAGSLQKRVFMGVLDGEVSISRKEVVSKRSEAETSLTAANYDFEFLRTETSGGKKYAIVQLIPKRKSKYLINGQAWVDIDARAVARVEGHTSANVSFWIGKAAISQKFRQVEDLWLPDSNQSASNVRFLGRTELTIEYSSYELNRMNEIARTDSLFNRE